jgi:SAM-dependent methyltransferase
MRNPFDSVALKYDAEFTLSSIGIRQREITRRLLLNSLKSGRKLRILEINCGTGEDAIWLARLGHEVVATDISDEMISVASEKARAAADEISAAGGSLNFHNLGFSQLGYLKGVAPFDLVWSNFGGLNCINSDELRSVSSILAGLIKSDGKLQMVLMARFCLWEYFFFKWRGENLKAQRRLRQDDADLGGESPQSTWCYSSQNLTEIFAEFQFLSKRPVGFLIPPSYLESWWKRHPKLTQLLQKGDNLMSSLGFISDFADHIYLSFKLRDSVSVSQGINR